MCCYQICFQIMLKVLVWVLLQFVENIYFQLIHNIYNFMELKNFLSVKKKKKKISRIFNNIKIKFILTLNSFKVNF